MSQRCRTEGGVLIPACIGSAVYGKDGCTCVPHDRADEIRRLNQLLERVAKLEEAIAALEAGIIAAPR